MRCVCGVLGLALFDAFLIGEISCPSNVHVSGLRCGVRCWVLCWMRCKAGRGIRGQDVVPFVAIGQVGPWAALSLALFVVPVTWLAWALRCWVIGTTSSWALRCWVVRATSCLAFAMRGFRGVGGSLGGAGIGSSLGGGGCAGHCLGGGTVSTGGGDALLALLVGIGPKRVRRASRSSPSSWAIFSAPRLRSDVTCCSRGACIKAFNAVLVAIAWLCRAGRGGAVRCKQENTRRLRARLQKNLQCTGNSAQSECSKKARRSGAVHESLGRARGRRS